MATLTVNFTASSNAVTYRIKYRRVGTSAYTTFYTTSSPAVINTGVDCGYDYEGTVEAICVEGIPCNMYQIINPDMYQEGDVEYSDCITGATVTQAVTYGANFTICSRNTPVILNMNSANVINLGSSGSCAQYAPTPEEASGPVYWTASAVDCVFYWIVTPCDPAALAVPNGAVKTSNSSIGIGDVVKLTGSGYVSQDPASLNCYQITDYGTGPTGVVVDDTTIFDNCLDCQNAQLP